MLARAEKGGVEAQRKLGIAYDDGEGVQQDYQQVGVERDPKLALKWYTKSFQAADPRGAEALGRFI